MILETSSDNIVSIYATVIMKTVHKILLTILGLDYHVMLLLFGQGGPFSHILDKMTLKWRKFVGLLVISIFSKTSHRNVLCQTILAKSRSDINNSLHNICDGIFLFDKGRKIIFDKQVFAKTVA